MLTGNLHKLCFRYLPGILFVLIALMFCGSCSQQRGPLFEPLNEALVWPGAPEKPRIKFVGVLSTEEDLKREVSWAEGFTRLIFGREHTGVLLGPYDVCTDIQQNLFIADTGGGNIHRFDLASRKYFQFSAISADQKLISPVSLVKTEGRIYVADSILQKICVFDIHGNYKFCFGEGSLERPTSIAYSQVTEMLYVADAGAHKIMMFTRDGKFVESIGSRGVEAGTFNYPTHVWIDKAGTLYVSDTLNYRVQIFSSDGDFVRKFGFQGDRPGNFAHPSGVATDSYGNIYVVDRQFENIQIFDANGRILMALGSEGSDFGQFWLPGGIFIDEADRIYVADSYNKRIQIFDLLKGEKP